MSFKLPSYPTRFVGRSTDLATLRTLLGRGERLITLLGPPGIGKTRLAVELSRSLSETGAFAGCWFVDLTDARDLDAFLSTTGTALGVPLTAGKTNDDSAAQLGHAIGGRGKALIVLDNFEQLVDLAPDTVGRWLAKAPDAHFLVTSRERLRIPGEMAQEISALLLPKEERDAARSEAVQLFVERVRAVRADFELEANDAVAVAEIVQRLDGIPLAIELAAARVGVLSPKQLLSMLRNRFEVLTGSLRNASERQATLRSAIDWSWNLLTPWEQSALAQCSVFRGGFTLESAIEVLDLSNQRQAPSTLDVVQALRDKSLLRVLRPTELAGEARYAMYESIREYASQKLADSGAQLMVQERHAAHHLKYGWELVEGINGPGGLEKLRRLVLERDNLTDIFARALEVRPITRHSAERALKALLTLDPVRQTRGPRGGQLETLDQAIEAGFGTDADRWLLASALIARATARRSRGLFTEAGADLDRAIALAREAGDQRSEALAVAKRAFLWRLAGRVPEAKAEVLRVLEVAETLGDRRVLAQLRSILGTIQAEEGNFDEAARSYRSALEVMRDLGDRRQEAAQLSGLAYVAVESGRVDEATELNQQALVIVREAGDLRAEAGIITNLACLQLESGHHDDALALYQRSYALIRDVGDRRMEAMALGYIAAAKVLYGHFPDALEALQEAVHIVHEAGDKRGQAMGRAGLGMVLAALGRTAEAKEDFDTAEKLYREIGEDKRLPVVDTHRGHLEVALAREARGKGDLGAAERHLARAQERLEQAVERFTLGLRLQEFRYSILGLRLIISRYEEGAETPEAPSSAAGKATVTDALVVSPDANWFRPPQGDWRSLSTHRSLRLLLKSFAEARSACPGQGYTVDQLLEIGWPGERVLPHAGVNRVRVALATLKRMGLRPILTRQGEHYLLDPHVPLLRARHYP